MATSGDEKKSTHFKTVTSPEQCSAKPIPRTELVDEGNEECPLLINGGQDTDLVKESEYTTTQIIFFFIIISILTLLLVYVGSNAQLDAPLSFVLSVFCHFIFAHLFPVFEQYLKDLNDHDHAIYSYSDDFKSILTLFIGGFAIILPVIYYRYCRNLDLFILSALFRYLTQLFKFVLFYLKVRNNFHTNCITNNKISWGTFFYYIFITIVFSVISALFFSICADKSKLIILPCLLMILTAFHAVIFPLYKACFEKILIADKSPLLIVLQAITAVVCIFSFIYFFLYINNFPYYVSFLTLGIGRILIKPLISKFIGKTCDYMMIDFENYISSNWFNISYLINNWQGIEKLSNGHGLWDTIICDIIIFGLKNKPSNSLKATA